MAVTKRAYFNVSKEDVYAAGVVSYCKIIASGNSDDTIIQYKEQTSQAWTDYSGPVEVRSKDERLFNFRAHPKDTPGGKKYEDYYINVKIEYVTRYDIGDYIHTVNATNTRIDPVTRLVYDEQENPYYEKCEYRGYHQDIRGNYGIYANPAKYEAVAVRYYKMTRTNVLPFTVDGSRTSILNFYDQLNNKVEEIMIRARITDGANANENVIFPSDADNAKIMSVRKSSNFSFDNDDINLSSILAGKNGIDFEKWYYSVNGIRREIPNILDYSFPWQAALTEVHSAVPNAKCYAQTEHYAIYNLYPVIQAKKYSVRFFDWYGYELSAYSSDNVEYQRSVWPPTNMPGIRNGNKILFHAGWIDAADGLQANTYEVTRDMDCTPYYSESIQDSDGIVQTSDLKKYMVELIKMQCDNVDEYYVNHDFYRSEYLRIYDGLVRTIDQNSFKYLARISSATLEKKVSDYMKQVDAVLDMYKDKLMNLGVVFLYYLAILYYIKNTVVYVHGYKPDDIGDYNACHVMYVPENVKDFEEYIKNFNLIEDLISVIMDTEDQYDIIYKYVPEKALTSGATSSGSSTTSSATVETTVSEKKGFEIFIKGVKEKQGAGGGLSLGSDLGQRIIAYMTEHNGLTSDTVHNQWFYLIQSYQYGYISAKDFVYALTHISGADKWSSLSKWTQCGDCWKKMSESRKATIRKIVQESGDADVIRYFQSI